MFLSTRGLTRERHTQRPAPYTPVNQASHAAPQQPSPLPQPSSPRPQARTSASDRYRSHGYQSRRECLRQVGRAPCDAGPLRTGRARSRASGSSKPWWLAGGVAVKVDETGCSVRGGCVPADIDRLASGGQPLPPSPLECPPSGAVGCASACPPQDASLPSLQGETSDRTGWCARRGSGRRARCVREVRRVRSVCRDRAATDQKRG